MRSHHDKALRRRGTVLWLSGRKEFYKEQSMQRPGARTSPAHSGRGKDVVMGQRKRGQKKGAQWCTGVRIVSGRWEVTLVRRRSLEEVSPFLS